MFGNRLMSSRRVSTVLAIMTALVIFLLVAVVVRQPDKAAVWSKWSGGPLFGNSNSVPVVAAAGFGAAIVVPANGSVPAVPNLAPPLAAVGSSDEDIPRGKPLDPKRSDWLITQSNAEHWANENISGLDLAYAGAANSFGSPLHATLRGVVGTLTDRGDGTGYGNAVYILGFVNPQTGRSYNTVNGHFQKLYVQDGQIVKRDDIIGEMGSTGFSTGPHVHYEVWKCQMSDTEIQKGIAPGTTNPSKTQCVAQDSADYIGQ